MKTYLFALTIALWLPHTAFGSPHTAQTQHEQFAPLPDWVTPIVTLPTSDPSGYHYDQEFLLVDRQLNLVPNTPVEYKRYTTKIVSIEGLESGSQISIDFDPSYQRVAIHRLEIVRNGQIIDHKNHAKISQFKRETDLDSLLYNGDETLHLVLSDVQVGDILDYSYTITGFNPVFGSNREWYIKTGWATSVALVTARIMVPESSPISVTNLNNKGKGTLKETTRGKMREYSYEENNSLYDFDESEQPPWFNPYPYLHVSSYNSWKDVVDWALPLYQASPSDSDVQALAQKIVQTYPDDLEQQMVAAIHYVQNNIRYLGIENGIGSHKPRPPQQTLSQGYGDCKDKALLLVSVLGALGVTAYPALVDTFWRDQLPQQPTAPYSFNHVIVQIEHQDKPLWIDATRTHQGNRLDTLAQANLGYALVLAPQTQELEAMPSSNVPVTQDVEQRYVVNHANQQSYLTVTTTYRGLEAEQWRRYLESKPLKELGEEYANYYAGDFGGLDFLRPLSVKDDRDANEVIINEAYVINELWSKYEDTYSFVISGDIVDDYLIKPDLVRRKTPFRYGSEGAIHQKITLSLPESWDIDQSDHAVSSPYFEFKSSLKTVSGPGEALLDKTYVEADYYYRAKKRHVDAKNLRQYIRHVDDAWDNVDYEFSYRQ
ncbi:DUF3857 and transglutaminase domain-containing protein [Enterovibrio sp. ZSDZ42]|uniref:DUF3857 and transglutaminase domain-containing protein n=1 Tax=Enterovibrio gelatinilyticus TaxID=2899819 RepID=A0ABT5QVF5_9GAMM|nr:DUF3857 and transglutaminase domain-containing protein [Enterovibrio sp. ZSDZ42]MDD1791925.1 DUF3857 and transglutaminase domain-containing protein [Enterovibrio sp. ZSDZ42]